MKNKIRKADIILLAAVIGIGAVLGIVLFLTRTGGAKVQVRVDGKVTQTFQLSTDRTYTIQGINGGTNELVISNGTAQVTEASCPDGLCVNMGKIRYNGESIICLPNKVVVEITGGEEDTADTGLGDVDVIAGGREG